MTASKNGQTGKKKPRHLPRPCDLPTLDDLRHAFGDELDTDNQAERDRAAERALGRRLDR